ncbi:MAG: hypothetical protein M1838_005518 [Thelocarpon superellum]|nr:MAG: hypothetical protein M1838_005518 [Thelocarpon superellum]
MAFTDDAVLAKLSALNETQESIVTVAQWVLFHKRHAERTAQLWMQRVKDSGANKKLNLIYLANEVVQQSKARRKDDFLIAFSPVIADAVGTAYRGATVEVQQKIRRVVEVWRQRQIFELPIQVAVETRIDDLDKSRSSGKRSILGGSFLSSSASTVPPELQPLVPLQTAVSKVSSGKSTTVTTANQEYDKLNDPATPTPSPPVHAARLSGLLKSLASAEGAVADSIKARRALIQGLEKILDTNRTLLQTEETQISSLTERKGTVEAQKREVEDGIMRGLAEESPSIHLGSASSGVDDLGASLGVGERPIGEELSPPSVEALTPTGTPPSEPLPPSTSTAVPDTETAVPSTLPTEPSPVAPAAPAGSAGSDLLSSLALMQSHLHSPPTATSATTNGTAGTGTAKKRKLNHHSGEEDFSNELGNAADGMDGLDDDVADILRQESGERRGVPPSSS